MTPNDEMKTVGGGRWGGGGMQFHMSNHKTTSPVTQDANVWLTHFKAMTHEGQTLADAKETLVICRMLVCLWRGQLPWRRGKGGSLAIPACNKWYIITLLWRKKKENLFILPTPKGNKNIFFLKSNIFNDTFDFVLYTKLIILKTHYD